MGGAKIKEYKEISFKLKGGYNQLGYASALLYFTFQADCGNNRGEVSSSLKGIYAKFQVIRGFSQKIPADLLSYDKIHS